MEKDVEELKRQVHLLRHELFGNGQPGVAENVRKLGARLDKIDTSVEEIHGDVSRVTTKIDTLAQKRRTDEDEKRGRDRLLKAAVAMLAFLVGGGGLAAWQVFRLLSRIAQ